LRREDTAIMIAASMLEARGLRVHWEKAGFNAITKTGSPKTVRLPK
jgi:hypothetical protein